MTGQILENWLVSFADGHGGIQNIEKIGTDVLADTYRITLADTTTFDFVVTNGKGISSITKTSTEELVDTYTISYNDGTSGTFTVTNGEKGDKGDNAYIWIKYASQEPTNESHSFGDIPDSWIGVYAGNLETAPDDWTQYQWFQIKGEKGDTGDPATLTSATVTYQVGDSGTIIPSGTWSESIPVVTQGKYLWTKIVQYFNTGDPISAYTISRMGIDGLGSVVSVCGKDPEENGNVPLDASDVKALAVAGGTMEGPVNMNGQKLSGLNTPTEATEAATKGYAIGLVKKAAPRNLLDNSNFANPINQRSLTTYDTEGYTIDRWNINTGMSSLTIDSSGVTTTAVAGSNGFFRQFIEWDRVYGKLMTFAVCTASGEIHLVTGTFPATAPAADVVYATLTGSAFNLYISGGKTAAGVQIRVNSGASVSFKWAALYEGEYTAETLPEYQPKEYSVELLECMRYYQRLGMSNGSTYFNIAQITSSVAKQIRTSIPTPIMLRVAPTATFSGNIRATSVTDGSVNLVSAIPYALPWASGVCVIFTLTDTLVAGLYIIASEANGYIELNADL